MKEELKAVYEVGKKILDVPKWAFIGTHMVPTCIRIADRYDNRGPLSLNSSHALPVAFFAGMVITPMMCMIEIGGGYEANNPYFIGAGCFTVATNIASGLYELYRHEKNKIKNPVVTTNPNSNSGLEEKVETPVNNTTNKPLEIIDPWKVDIDELEAIAYGGRR